MCPRQSKRHHLIYYLNVFNNDTNEKLGQLADVSPEGLMVMRTKPFIQDTTYNLRLEHTDPNNHAITLIFTARMAWTKQDINPDYYIAGFEITQIDPQTLNLVTSLIDHIGFKD